ncbi:late control protein D [Clostridium botulinum]|nr:late control protein D [Clostridium botulinum]
MGEINRLRVKSPYELMKIVDIKIENKPNEHGYLYLKCLIDDSIKFNYTIKASTKDEIYVYEELEDKVESIDSNVNINEVNEGNSRRLFCGIVENIKTSNIDGVYYLEIEALTSTYKLDIKDKSRSFQNISMTYDELIGKMLKEYTGFSFNQNIGNGKKIGKPLFQYKETDWNFLKRIASELKSELYCDIIMNYMFNFGMDNKYKYNMNDNISYSAFKDIKKFHEFGGYNEGYNDTDYFYYEVKLRDIFQIGSEINFREKNLYIREYKIYKDKEEILYKYKLCRKNAVWQNIIYNNILRGASLEGKVLAVEGEKVKLHLNIDEVQNQDEAYWFDYAPPSVNLMYSMPLVGERARLYFPNESSEKPIITGCIRSNGDTCGQMKDTSSRYLQTEHGSEIALLPNALNINGGSKEPLSISFDDAIGVTLTSPNELSLNAFGAIIIQTHKQVNINATSQLEVIKTNTTSGVSIEGEIHIKGNNVIKNGSSRESYAPFAEGGE